MPADAPFPLGGIRVLDLGTITAGAACSALLLDLGAEVVKVEGPSALDPFRYWEGAGLSGPWWDQSPVYAFTNRGKESVCIDLKDPRGRDVVLHLLEGADVLVENYRRGVLATLGLAPSMLRRRFPRLVVASVSSQGEDGPERDGVSFGSTLEATGGMAALTGTGAGPVVSGRDLNYPDQIVSLFAAGAVLAALAERDRTGQGVHLDLSQRELTTFLLGEEMIAAGAGLPSPRRGNADPAEPEELVVADGDGWRVEWPGGTVPVRDGAAVLAAPEFTRGTAVTTTPTGRLAKGLPFRLERHALRPCGEVATLGQHNRTVLARAGLEAGAIDRLERDGILATAPRRTGASGMSHPGPAARVQP